MRRRIARLEARLLARGIRARTLRGLEVLSPRLREFGLRAALMLFDS